MRGLEGAKVAVTKSRYHIGSEIDLPYDSARDTRTDVYYDENGDEMAKNCMEWFIERVFLVSGPEGFANKIVTQNEEITHNAEKPFSYVLKYIPLKQDKLRKLPIYYSTYSKKKPEKKGPCESS